MEIILEREEKSVIWGRGSSNGRTGSDLRKKQESCQQDRETDENRRAERV